MRETTYNAEVQKIQCEEQKENVKTKQTKTTRNLFNSYSPIYNESTSLEKVNRLQGVQGGI